MLNNSLNNFNKRRARIQVQIYNPPDSRIVFTILPGICVRSSACEFIPTVAL